MSIELHNTVMGQRLIERSEYLTDQRDKYVEELIDSK